MLPDRLAEFGEGKGKEKGWEKEKGVGEGIWEKGKGIEGREEGSRGKVREMNGLEEGDLLRDAGGIDGKIVDYFFTQ